jgi:hypothetical protein
MIDGSGKHRRWFSHAAALPCYMRDKANNYGDVSELRRRPAVGASGAGTSNQKGRA